MPKSQGPQGDHTAEMTLKLQDIHATSQKSVDNLKHQITQAVQAVVSKQDSISKPDNFAKGGFNLSWRPDPGSTVVNQE